MSFVFLLIGLFVLFYAARRPAATLTSGIAPIPRSSIEQAPDLAAQPSGATQEPKPMHERMLFEHPQGDIYFDNWADDDYGEFQYTTRDGRHDFVFELVPEDELDHDGEWFIDDEVVILIIEQPKYGGRHTGLHETHRLSSKTTATEHYGVCVGREFDPPTSVPEALSWTTYWAEQTGNYIDTGAEFS